MLRRAGFRDIETASFYGRDSATFRKLTRREPDSPAAA